MIQGLHMWRMVLLNQNHCTMPPPRTLYGKLRRQAPLITTFRQFVGGLNSDREAILGSLDQISQLSVQTASLVKGIRSPLVDDIANLRKLTANIQRNRGELDRALQVLPIKLEKVGRTAVYGSWFNFYLCQFHGKVTVAGVTVPVQYNTGSDRCAL
jgi:phospholipid/cholesterol/gamma-HCH transport system substrate-binding protein